MTEHTGLAAKLKELGEKATPGEWLAQKGAGWLITRPGAAKRHEGAMLVGMRAETSLIDAPKGDEQEAAANAALIVALVNNLSAIIAALEARPPATEGEVERGAVAVPAMHDLIMAGVPITHDGGNPGGALEVAAKIAAWLREPGRNPSERASKYTAAVIDDLAVELRAALSAARPSREEG